ncbi:tetratricopeptide repeat protein [Leptobacterium flavescens]|uniref:Tetratricopeptide repeat protein n=1 Tax=Leptobacterium flavescens TaxID=472055 RepID=A0A6P0UMV5_9FLAO|nr:SH3 domain-containing protein [Leptobacterium flavescens]NER14337.1 tetratricopeptide repeat protein [Leptobacterium flavescens]
MKKLFFAILFISFFASGQNTALFEEANKLYNEGDYEGAINKYEKILESGEHSAELYFNLGNANYKLNHVAPTIYYYEKALLLAPNDEDIRNNMAFAQNMTLDAIETLPQTGIAKMVENSVGRLSYDTWAVLSIVFMILFVATFLFYYFSFKQNLKRLFFITSILAIFLCVLSVSMAFHEYNAVRNDRPAIVFAIESAVKSEPNDRGENVFLLHEGTKVNVTAELNGWKKIKLADGKIGWISSEDIRELKNL